MTKSKWSWWWKWVFQTTAYRDWINFCFLWNHHNTYDFLMISQGLKNKCVRSCPWAPKFSSVHKKRERKLIYFKFSLIFKILERYFTELFCYFFCSSFVVLWSHKNIYNNFSALFVFKCCTKFYRLKVTYTICI